MIDSAPTPGDGTAECPRDRWREHFPHCWLCDGSGERHRIPTEVAAAYRVGNIDAVMALVTAHPEDYSDIAGRIAFDPYRVTPHPP